MTLIIPSRPIVPPLSSSAGLRPRSAPYNPASTDLGPRTQSFLFCCRGPAMPSLSQAKLTRLHELRAAGRTLQEIADELECANSTVSNAIHYPDGRPAKKEAKPTPKPKPKPVLPRVLHSHCPMKKRAPVNPKEQPRPRYPTKQEMQEMLAAAVRNTSSL
jgi:hypothetical protein